ncbi:hypothetical protein, partial [Brevibacillus sp. SIMBA_040]|uniref:hypothetical protein n=1 Tax=Brevibacillus sp. SIMBA_040 TaxID=3085781 RepID=UPI00397D70E1
HYMAIKLLELTHLLNEKKLILINNRKAGINFPAFLCSVLINAFDWILSNPLLNCPFETLLFK